MVKSESNFNLVMKNYVSSEEFLNNFGVDVYAITMVKFILCYDWLKNCFTRENKLKFTIDNSNCDICAKSSQGLCRQHRSIQRVLNCSNPLYIKDMDCYLYRNEIFKKVGNKIIIVYCSHTKLIKDGISENKVKKVMPITLQLQENENLPEFKPAAEITTAQLFANNYSCWFNDTFTLLIDYEDKKAIWSLILNKVE